MIFSTKRLSMLAVLALSTTTAVYAKGALMQSLAKTKVVSTKNAERILAGDWRTEFIGQLNFQLIDDPIFASGYQTLKNLEAELIRTQQILSDKKKQLDNTVAGKNIKVAELQKQQISLEAKNKLKTDSEKDKKLQETKVESLANSILANQNIIKVQQGEVEKLTQEFNFWKSENDNAAISVTAKQAALDAAMNACTTADPTADCTQNRDVIYAREMLNQAVQRKNYLQTQFNAVDIRLKDANGKITQANADIAQATTDKAAAIAKIATLTSTIEGLGKEIPVIIATMGTLTDEIKNLSSIEVGLIDDVKRITSIEQSQGFSYQQAKVNFDKMQQDLIDQILAFNHAGFDKANQDGAQEGIEIANNVGGSLGTNQGQAAGLKKGEADGRARDYQIGAQQGEGDGSRDGKIAGAKAGDTDGKQAGYKAAGDKEGVASGINKAIASDAGAVGTNQGNQAGMQRASATGAIQGKQQGEAQAISSLENRTLGNIFVNGQFSGTFQQNMPAFPGVQGKYFNNNINNTRKVLRDAFVAGYNVGYAGSAEKVYYANVQQVFNQAYSVSYKNSYDKAFNHLYEDSIRQGRGQQYENAFNREFKLAHDETYRQSFDGAIHNPDRQGSIFINAFKTSEASAYNSKYQEIKDRAYGVAESNTFNNNIAAQTDKARIERLGQVTKIYQNFPVLKFVSSQVDDMGIRGVAANDDFFMPGEDVIHDLVIANYGDAQASGVKVALKTGEIFTLPAIPGNSLVTIRGGAKEKVAVTALAGSMMNTNLVVKFGLTSSEKQIQGRHFSNSSDGTMNPGDAKNIKVDYPLAVTELRFSEALVLNKEVGIKATVVNRSQKDFSAVKLDLDSSMGHGIITNNFTDIGFIDQSATKADATVKVSDDERVFADVNLSLTLKINDVVVGKLEKAASETVKVPFKNINGAPVVVLSSKSVEAREDFKDLASELGGMDNVSILDLAGFAENQATLDSKLSGKTVLVIEGAGDSVLPRLNGLFKTPKVFVGFMGEGASENIIVRAKSAIGNLRDATLSPLDVNRTRFRILSTSPILVEGLAQKVSATEFKLSTVDAALALAESLKLSDDALLEAITAKVSKESMLSKEEKSVLLTKILGLRVLEDAAQINTGFLTADKRRERKDWKKRMSEDQSLIVSKIAAKLEKGSREEQIGIGLSSIPVQHAVEVIAEGSNLEKKIKKAVVKATEDFQGQAAKDFKKLLGDKKLAEQIESIAEAFFPTI